jgi:tetratricopeptide (TPR) repeat protein
MRSVLLVLVLYLGASGFTPVTAGAEDPRLDALFTELQALDKRRDDRARELQARIWAIWYEHEDPAVTRFMETGLHALADYRPQAALDAFTRATERDADFAEAWNRRATTYYLLDRYQESLDDIERVLELEPRHFGALAGRGLCQRALGRPAAAIDAFERALEINPHMDGVYIEILRLRARSGVDI